MILARKDHAGLTFATSHQDGPQHSGHFSYALPAILVRNAAKGIMARSCVL